MANKIYIAIGIILLFTAAGFLIAFDAKAKFWLLENYLDRNLRVMIVLLLGALLVILGIAGLKKEK